MRALSIERTSLKPHCLFSWTFAKGGRGLAMKTRRHLASIRYPLGSFGLLLVVLVGRLADHAYPSSSAHYGRVTPFLPRRAIAGIAVVGAILQRYPGVGVLETVRADICRPELLVEIECTFGVDALAPDLEAVDRREVAGELDGEVPLV